MSVSIRLYSQSARDRAGQYLPAGQEPAIGNLEVAVTGASVQSAVFDDRASFALMVARVDCRFDIGANPTAGPTSTFLPAGSAVAFGLAPGASLRAAVIQA